MRLAAKRIETTNLAVAGSYRADLLTREDSTAPVGDLVVKVTKNGLATLRGVLPNGQAFVNTTVVYGDGTMPVYQYFKRTTKRSHGFLGGPITLDPDTLSRGVAGSLGLEMGG